MTADETAEREVPEFARGFFRSEAPFCRIGSGRIGGKAGGLVRAAAILQSPALAESDPRIRIAIPRFVVLASDVFDAFMARNRLSEIALSDAPDDRIAHAFQKAELPSEILGDLRSVVEEVRTPLAVRSSSLLEDALFRPFAGVYATKMTPNNQAEASARFQKLSEAVKFVFASTFFKAAKDYIRTTSSAVGEEKMAVLLQEVVGARHDERFYPHLSGVCRSFNFYPFGRARAEDGVVDLALGLGKSIVDGEAAYTYSPARPKAPPPIGSVRDLLKESQREFWAVNMGRPPAFDPIAETEYLVHAGLPEADYDGVLSHVASTYEASADRMVPGTGSPGPRAITFAPLLVLESLPLNRTLRLLMAACEQALASEVEIEFAMTLPGPGSPGPARLGFLQVRAMVVSNETVDVSDAELARPELLLASDTVMGNGISTEIRDVVFLKPDAFDVSRTGEMVADIERLNTALFAQARPYLLIGFGRWGSSDPWMGIPVNWGQICGARAIVEAAMPERMIDASQGSHFFHNLSSFKVCYFTIPADSRPPIDWDWLQRQPAAADTPFVRHAALERPLLMKVDGRAHRGAVWHTGESS